MIGIRRKLSYSIDGRIILKWILERVYGVARNEFFWLRIEINGRHVLIRRATFELHAI
jgi:hypothetical protein